MLDEVDFGALASHAASQEKLVVVLYHDTILIDCVVDDAE